MPKYLLESDDELEKPVRIFLKRDGDHIQMLAEKHGRIDLILTLRKEGFLMLSDHTTPGIGLSLNGRSEVHVTAANGEYLNGPHSEKST